MARKPKRKAIGRPGYRRSDEAAKTVETMAGYGISVPETAAVVGISEPTLRKYYAAELERGQVKANLQVAQSLFKRALSDAPNAVTAAIFWLKCRAGWREQDQVVGKKQAADEAARMPSVGGIDDLLAQIPGRMN
jgi:hypothetical protein